VRLAAVDVGTNTIRLMIAEAGEEQPPFSVLRRKHVITRLGEGIGTERVLKEGAIERSVDILSAFKTMWESMGASAHRVVATSAVREAQNKDMFLHRALSFGVTVDVISEEEEAGLVLRGAQLTVPIDEGNSIFFDIGGGSTEFISVCFGSLEKILSTDLGVVRLKELFIGEYPPGPVVLDSLVNYVDKRIRMVYNQLSGVGEIHRLVGTAGTVTTLAAVDQGLSEYDPQRIDSYRITARRLDELIKQFTGLTEQGILDCSPIITPGREDVIIPGMILVHRIMSTFSKDHIVVSDRGILEGIVLGLMNTI
jgi:exopolyphosphatase/guanosine-5'-triphosphate,3'-diphosphate pyrophosphatase